jgi:hypothetical protein
MSAAISGAGRNCAYRQAYTDSGPELPADVGKPASGTIEEGMAAVSQKFAMVL